LEGISGTGPGLDVDGMGVVDGLSVRKGALMKVPLSFLMGVSQLHHVTLPTGLFRFPSTLPAMRFAARNVSSR